MNRCLYVSLCKFWWCIENKNCLHDEFDKRNNKKNIIDDKKFIPCHYCGKLKLSDKMTIDHIIPKSKGGKKNKENVVLE